MDRQTVKCYVQEGGGESEGEKEDERGREITNRGLIIVPVWYLSSIRHGDNLLHAVSE